MSQNTKNNTTNNNLIDLLQQTLTEFQRLNLNLENLNNNFEQTIPSAIVTNTIQPSTSSLADHQSVDVNSPISVGDTVIILHRFHGQYGVIDTVYRITNDYYRIRTPLGVEYQKKKRFVARYTGNR
jgi:hypothetical protein